MNDRIQWQKGDRPDHFIAKTGSGTAEIWHQETGHQGTEGWRWRIVIGETRETGTGNDRQHASDEANRALPNIVRREQVRLDGIAAKAKLHAQIEAAYTAGTVDVMAFGLGSAHRDTLVDILNVLKNRGWLDGPLMPLREAVSEELYRRRVGNR